MIINPDTNDQNEGSSVFNSNGKDSTEDFGELSMFQWTVAYVNILNGLMGKEKFEYGNWNSPVFSGDDPYASAGAMSWLCVCGGWWNNQRDR